MVFNKVVKMLLFISESPSSLLSVIVFFLTWAGLWLPIAVVSAIALQWRPSEPLKTQKLPLLASLYLIAPIVLWETNRLTGASFSDYGVSWDLWTLRSLGIGLSLGVLSLTVLFAVQTALGWVTWQPIDKRQLASVLLPTLLIALLVSVIEEIVFRGFLLTQLRQDYSVELAAAISSLIFALLHLVWEQKETIPQLPGLWLMGMVLVLARYLDGGSLGLAWGLHSGWVWVIASLDTAQMVSYTGIGSEWVTGKNGKPLAGVAGILCLLATGSILLMLV